VNRTWRQYVGGILATVGIFAFFFGFDRLTPSRAVNLALLIAGLVSVPAGVKLHGRSRPVSGKHPRASHVPERGGNQGHHVVPR